MRGTVISLHGLGATVRLEDGALAAVPVGEVRAHEAAYAASFRRREPVTLEVEVRGGRHCVAFLAGRERERPGQLAGIPSVHDTAFEEQMRRYLKETEEWAPPDRPAPADRHFIRKKRRAAQFEARARTE
jgi:hypothetical protein